MIIRYRLNPDAIRLRWLLLAMAIGALLGWLLPV
jgi:hypothetical protein